MITLFPPHTSCIKKNLSYHPLPLIPVTYCLSLLSDVFLDVVELLQQPFPSLLRHGELDTVTCVVSGQHVNRGVKEGEGLLAINSLESSIVRYELINLVLRLLCDISEQGVALLELDCVSHVVNDL